MRDLTSAAAIKLKGLLFLILGLLAAALLVLEHPTWKTLILLAVCVWAFCRSYYFAFYVIEKYLDPKFRFSGLWSAIRHLIQRKPDEESRKVSDTDGPQA